MNQIITFILKLTWFHKYGRSVKYYLKHKTNLRLKKTGWTLHLFETRSNVLEKKWKRLNTYGWFTIKDGHRYIDGIADPFLFSMNNRLYLFFETEITDKKGEIWCAEIENNSLKNPQKVIDETFHMSFPYVFNNAGEIFMVPESYEDTSVRLYKSIEFPNKWDFVKPLFTGKSLVDVNFFIKEETYYWFCYDLDIKKTRLYYSLSLDEKWIEHPKSLFESNRNAGKIFVKNNKIYRPVQIEVNNYGEGVKLNEIVTLTQKDFKENSVENPFLEKGKKYFLDGVHHFSFVEKNESESYVMIDGLNNNYYQAFKD